MKKPKKADTKLTELEENYALSVRKRRQVLDMIVSLPEDVACWDMKDRDSWKNLHRLAGGVERIARIN